MGLRYRGWQPSNESESFGIKGKRPILARFAGVVCVLAALLWPGLPASSKAHRTGVTSGGFTLEMVVKRLQSVPAGRAMLAEAHRQWKQDGASGELLNFLQWGSVSKTDAILTRHYDPATGVEQRERQIVIYLRRDLSLDETVLDLAHEVVHAKEPPSWDPYDPELTPGKYIFASIEGPGGEVDAVVGECRVALELAGATRAKIAERCGRYFDADSVSALKVKKDFYCVGKWKGRLLSKLGHEVGTFPHLSDAEPKLFSSTGHTPYPVALFEEFEQMNQVACRNSKKRVEAARDPASDPRGLRRKDATRFLARRCVNAEV